MREISDNVNNSIIWRNKGRVPPRGIIQTQYGKKNPPLPNNAMICMAGSFKKSQQYT